MTIEQAKQFCTLAFDICSQIRRHTISVKHQRNRIIAYINVDYTDLNQFEYFYSEDNLKRMAHMSRISKIILVDSGPLLDFSIDDPST